MYYFYDKDGFFDGQSEISGANSTEIVPPEGLYRPKFDGTEWIEGATAEEMEPPPGVPVVNDSQAVNELTEAVEYLIGRVDGLEQNPAAN